VYTEARTLLRAVMTNFFFNCWCLEIPSDNRIRHVPRCSTVMRKTLDWKRSMISMYTTAPNWTEYCFVYENFVACGEI
jgi:hypothetical protein